MQYNIQSLLYRKDELNAHNLLEEVGYLISILPEWKEKKECWIIAHHSQKIIAFDAHGYSDEALADVQYLIDNKKTIYLVFADENEDDSVISITYKNTPAVSTERYILTLIIKSLVIYNSYKDFINILNGMIKYNGWDFKYIRVETEQYSFNRREVFEDRLSVGWMLYLPAEIIDTVVPSAFYLYRLENEDGTIVVSKENFRGDDLADVLCANNVEIELAANGQLPLVRGI